MSIASIPNRSVRRCVVVAFTPITVGLLVVFGALGGIVEAFEGFWSDVKDCWDK